MKKMKAPLKKEKKKKDDDDDEVMCLAHVSYWLKIVLILFTCTVSIGLCQIGRKQVRRGTLSIIKGPVSITRD